VNRITVTPVPVHKLTFDVVVRDAHGESRHRVIVQSEDATHWVKLGAKPLLCIEAAMRFLLDREPKDSILGAFDMGVIRRYFPEFGDALPRYLARPRGKPGRGVEPYARGI
jgi:hypothetical protein